MECYYGGVMDLGVEPIIVKKKYMATHIDIPKNMSF